MNSGQNQQIELLSKLALHGGGYAWNAIPISDASSPEDSSFEISQPLSKFVQESHAAARRRNSALLVEPYDDPNVKTEEYSGVGPRNPYMEPAGVVRTAEGERLSVRNEAGPRTFRESFGSGEGAASKRAVADQILRMFDAFLKKRRKKNRDERAPSGASRLVGYIGTSGVQREAEDEPEGDQRTGKEREQHVAGDRQAAFDLALPLSNEQLASWNAYLRKKIDAYGPAMPWFKALDGFLERVKGGHRFHELSWDEKAALTGIVEKIVETA